MNNSYAFTLQRWVITLSMIAFSSVVFAQKAEYRFIVSPEKPIISVGDTLPLSVKVIDSEGKEVDQTNMRFFSRNSKVAAIDRSKPVLYGMSGGVANVIMIRADAEGNRARHNLEVKVNFPNPDNVAFVNAPTKVFTGTNTRITTRISDKGGNYRDDLKSELRTSNTKIASFDEFGNLIAHKKGKIQLIATVDKLKTKIDIEVVKNPVTSLELSTYTPEARTGDVIEFQLVARDKSGKMVQGIPVNYTFQGMASNPSYTASGMIAQDGRFVAYEPGMYAVTATSGMISATRNLNILERDIQRKIEFVGRGTVNNVHTSDLWVWEGEDGNDYAVTGTWGADGEAYFWDVTDPANIIPIDTVKVDARTVNDVKISENGKICVISREGASNRKNGIVIIDVSNPRDAKVITEYTKELTGGVHNLFIYKDHVYALSNGERYDIINIEDPANPRKVGTFELDRPGHSIHDVWIEDGIAYSSNWRDGVQVVDIGNGMAGGAPDKPVKITEYAYPSGWNHAAFPFKSPSTGKFYIIAGDEAFPNGLFRDDKPTYAGGYLHVIDFTDMDNPKEVAYFEVPGAGSHNYWIEGETLYVANYNAGLRVVDISGDLMGNLFEQGREIGWFKPTDKEGRIPNAPMTWGPQPHKGHIFFSDWNSGIWSVKLETKQKDVK